MGMNTPELSSHFKNQDIDKGRPTILAWFQLKLLNQAQEIIHARIQPR